MNDTALSTSTPVVVHSIEVTPIEYRGQRVLTFAQIDKIHARPEGTARKRFNDNKDRMTEGEDYVVIGQPSEIRTLGLARADGSTAEKITLVTESGYLLLVKSFTDDLAWQIQKQLVKVYFRYQAEIAPPPPIDTLSAQQYNELTRALQLAGWLFQREGTQNAVHDHIRTVLNVRHLKDIPAAQFPLAMQLAKGIQERADLVLCFTHDLLDDLVRHYIAAGSPSTMVLARQYKQRFKAAVPDYPNWLEIQRQLSCPVLAVE